MAKSKFFKSRRKSKKLESGQHYGIPWGAMKVGEMIVYDGTHLGARANAYRASLRYAPMKFGTRTIDGTLYVTRKK